MINQKIVIALITLTLVACSSYKPPKTLDGKKREPINKFRYTEPPLVIINPIKQQNIVNTVENIKPTPPSINRQITPAKTIDILDAEEREKKG